MKYFKNTELAKLYNVSEKSVRNWIDAAESGKLPLELYVHNDKPYIANVTKNTKLIEELVQRGKKYKNRRGFRVVSPNDDFYELYNDKQILSIINSLGVHKEIPLQYSYFDGGAKYWDQYAKRLINEQTSNVLNQTITLLTAFNDPIDQLTANHRKVNVIDLGPGNGLPVRDLLAHLLQQGKLNKYIAIDCSPAMLDILKKNIEEWFGGKVEFQGYVQDFSYERFDSLLTDDYTGDDQEVPVNIVCLLGGTPSNFRSPNQILQTVNGSMNIGDLLIYSGYLDTPKTRRYFDFYVTNVNQKLSARHKLILDLMNVEENLYDVEQIFDEAKRARSVSFIPRIDISIKFNLAKGSRYVELHKGESILLWRHAHKTAIEVINEFDANGFDLLHASKSIDGQYLMTISKIKVEER
jgi:uncharacterized SAM-dependent methyltransferase